MEPSNGHKPEVSIIVGVTPRKGFNSIFNLLETIFSQKGDITFECIVVDAFDKQREKIYREYFPHVKLVQTEALLYEPCLRNIGMKQAQSEIITFLEDHILLSRSYLKNLVKLFSNGYKIVGGTVANANPESFFGWTQYFCEYNKWIPGLPAGIVEDLPGCNFSYHAEVLKKLGPFPEGEFGVDTYFHKKAKYAGYKLYLCSGLEVAHVNDTKLRVTSIERFKYGQLFAARRGFTRRKQILYIVLSPVIAILEYIRIFKHTRHNSFYLKKLIHCTPFLLPILFIWMMGECSGYLFGYGRPKTKNG